MGGHFVKSPVKDIDPLDPSDLVEKVQPNQIGKVKQFGPMSWWNAKIDISKPQFVKQRSILKTTGTPITYFKNEKYSLRIILKKKGETFEDSSFMLVKHENEAEKNTTSYFSGKDLQLLSAEGDSSHQERKIQRVGSEWHTEEVDILKKWFDAGALELVAKKPHIEDSNYRWAVFEYLYTPREDSLGKATIAIRLNPSDKKEPFAVRKFTIVTNTYKANPEESGSMMYYGDITGQQILDRSEFAWARELKNEDIDQLQTWFENGELD